MRRRLVAGNWKMHGSRAVNLALLSSLKRSIVPIDGLGVAVCAPFPYLSQVADSLRGSSLVWGAQDLSEHDVGPYTGEVSGPMLADFGCAYVLVGHSERRVLHGETDRQIAAKFGAAQRAGLIPVLCVGETLEQRDGGEMQAVLRRQVDAVLKASGVAAFRRAVVAYEPVWAIGTGRTATPAQAQAAHLHLRSLVAAQDAGLAAELTIVYGGSVKPGNAKEIFSMPDVDGGLIGGASLVAEDFTAICSAAAAAQKQE
ncbi:MAG: triose-phosphate isomerase [Betaproteobacteria bacterium RIFCSPLOWO2_02_FULL_62_17]|nr:MAG: triose-phosphate isomerase [Betaproteobacteria bacterium RIFCSPLOWO2_02_FULL_62_17]